MGWIARRDALLVLGETLLGQKQGEAMAEFPGTCGIFGECWTNFVGDSMIVFGRCRIFLRIRSVSGDFVKKEGWVMAKLPRNLW